MKILAVDYGDARTGVAVCDKLEMMASPLCVISESDTEKLTEKLLFTISEQKPELIVVGLPRNMDGSYGERSQKCKEFAELLKEKSGIDVDMWDERLTTVISYRALNSANVYGKKSKKVVDAVAATTILQDYLNYRKNNSSKNAD